MKKPYRAVSLKFLAEYLGLSQGTVSMALSPHAESTGVAAKTRELVRKTAAQYNYRPNHLARSLSKGRSDTIGVIVPAISEGYYSTLISSIEIYLLERNYFFLVTSHRWNNALLERLPSLLISRGAEGLILINTQLKAPTEVPAVRIGGTQPHPHSTNVCVNEDRGTRLALEHLHSLGHRRIAFMHGERESTATQSRWAGIRKAAQDLDLAVSPDLTVYLSLEAGPESARSGSVGYHAAHELLARGQPFTALFAYNDSTALGAIRAFQDKGIRVPEEISVVGYDDIPSAEYERPALTTVHQPLNAMGEQAAHVLIEAIEGGAQPKRILVEPRLAVRASTAAASAMRATRRKTLRGKVPR